MRPQKLIIDSPWSIPHAKLGWQMFTPHTIFRTHPGPSFLILLEYHVGNAAINSKLARPLPATPKRSNVVGPKRNPTNKCSNHIESQKRQFRGALRKNPASKDLNIHKRKVQNQDPPQVPLQTLFRTIRDSAFCRTWTLARAAGASKLQNRKANGPLSKDLPVNWLVANNSATQSPCKKKTMT